MDEQHYTPADTRRAKRLKLEVPAFFSIDKSMGTEVRLQTDERVLKAITKNINSKGVAIETDLFLPCGTILDLEINIHKETDSKFTSSIQVLGRIVAVKPALGGKYRMSIVFTKIDDKDKDALEAYVKEKFGE